MLYVFPLEGFIDEMSHNVSLPSHWSLGLCLWEKPKGIGPPTSFSIPTEMWFEGGAFHGHKQMPYINWRREQKTNLGGGIVSSTTSLIRFLLPLLRPRKKTLFCPIMNAWKRRECFRRRSQFFYDFTKYFIQIFWTNSCEKRQQCLFLSKNDRPKATYCFWFSAFIYPPTQRTPNFCVLKLCPILVFSHSREMPRGGQPEQISGFGRGAFSVTNSLKSDFIFSLYLYFQPSKRP